MIKQTSRVANFYGFKPSQKLLMQALNQNMSQEMLSAEYLSIGNSQKVEPSKKRFEVQSKYVAHCFPSAKKKFPTKNMSSRKVLEHFSSMYHKKL